MMKTRTTLFSLGAVAVLGVPLLVTPAYSLDVIPEDALDIVSLGDSYISGEGGRWAGNRHSQTGSINTEPRPGEQTNDALGPQAYWDTPTGESQQGCHRSKSAPVHINKNDEGTNLACSGAKTKSEKNGDTFTPGLDFYNKDGEYGQAEQLRQLATERKRNGNPIRTVVVTIGGNDFGFADTVTNCVAAYVFKKKPCTENPDVIDHFSPENAERVTQEIVTGLTNVHQAMKQARYRESAYRMIVTNYGNPLPTSKNIRFTDRESRGKFSCMFHDQDLNAAEPMVLQTINKSIRKAFNTAGKGKNWTFIDYTNMYRGKELCSQGTTWLSETPHPSWQNSDYYNTMEWITAINIPSPQESLHPNYGGQLAQRNCLRQTVSAAPGATYQCSPGTGTNIFNEPNVVRSQVL